MATLEQDEMYMRLALEQAKIAAAQDETPIGAVLVWDGEVVASAYNRRELDKRATAHAEILAIEEACRKLGGWRLHKATLYVTLEPCPMCAGAIINARIPGAVQPPSGSLRRGFGGGIRRAADLLFQASAECMNIKGGSLIEPLKFF